MKRVSVFAAAVIGLALAGQVRAQGQPAGAAPAATPAPRAGGKMAVFNVARVMKDYKRWQHFAAVMNQKRTNAAAELGKIRSEIADLQDKIQKEAVQTKKDEMTKLLVEKQRTFEDRERAIRKMLDDESAGYLRGLFAEIQQAVKAIVDTNGFDIVLSYPDAITAEETNSPLYYDLKLRPPAAMPFYVAPSADMTDVLIATLNKHFPPPAGAAPAAAPTVTPTSGTK